MFDKMCPHCLSDGDFLESGHDETGRTFKIYGCKNCRNMTRVFDTPVTEREVVLVALVAEALSANEPIPMTRSEALTIDLVRTIIEGTSIDVPEREKLVEEQLQLWSDEPRVWY